MSEAHAVSAGRVLVTGASRGIGRAVAEALLERGATLAVVGRDTDPLLALSKLAPARVTLMICDLSEPEARRQVVPRAFEALGGLDGLVSAAGIIHYETAAQLREESLREQLEVDLIAPLMLARDAGLTMGEGGSIVHISSTLAVRAAPSTVAYAVAKAGLEASVRGLALELAPRGVRVNAVRPGVVDTDMIRQARPGEAGGEEAESTRLRALAQLHPLGRIGRPEEVAAAALYLLDAPFVTGSCLTVDGGQLAG